MKRITECFENSFSIGDLMNEGRVDEGLKDILNYVKTKFKQAWQYLSGIISKFGTYFLPVNDKGEVLPAIAPPTMGQAMKEGYVNKESTFIKLDRDGEKITGFKSNKNDAAKLYGSGNSIKYWMRAVNECLELRGEEMINEVKMHTEDPQAKYNVVDTPALKARIKMAFNNKKLARLMIWGAPGIGKTAILMSVLDELPDGKNYNLVVKTLSNETPDNFTLPKYVEIDGQEKATDVPKAWLPVYKPTGDVQRDEELDAACGKGLLFIDELSRATPQVLNVMLPLINEGVFNGYKLGSGWVIIVASNRMEDEMSGQTELGNALSNRFAQLYYEPTVKTWREWADKQNFMSPLLLQWLSLPESENMSGGKFFYMDPNEEMDSISPTKLMCTPRSWTNAMRELACYSNTGDLEGFTIFEIPRQIIAMTLNQYVPASAVDSFLAFLEVIQSIGNFDQVVEDVWSGGKGLKLDKKNMNKIALPLAQLICTSHNNSLPTTEEFVNLANWLASLNSDQMASYVLDVFKNVFLAKVPERSRDIFFIIHKRKALWEKDPNGEAYRKAYENSYSEFMKQWGIPDIDNCPDYSVGLKIIAGKYKDAFKSAIVDGKEALG